MDGDRTEDSENNAVSDLHLHVTDLQKETIGNLFNHYDWEFTEVSAEKTPENQDSNAATGDIAHQDGSVDLDPPECVPGYHVNHIQGQAECEYCLCKPCITDERNRQLWWEEESQEPNCYNHKRRKDVYKRFWTMLYHRNVWND